MIPFTVEPDGAHTVEAAILSPLEAIQVGLG